MLINCSSPVRSGKGNAVTPASASSPFVASPTAWRSAVSALASEAATVIAHSLLPTRLRVGYDSRSRSSSRSCATRASRRSSARRRRRIHR